MISDYDGHDLSEDDNFYNLIEDDITSHTSEITDEEQSLVDSEITNSVEIDTGDEVVYIPDQNLLKEINNALSRDYSTLPVIQKDLALLDTLNTYNYSISDLTGLEFAVNLTTLNIVIEKSVDLIPLTSLKNLRYLYFHDFDFCAAGKDGIQLDITPLTTLELNELGFRNIHIKDLTKLSGMKSLQALDISGGKNEVSLEFVRPLENLIYFGYHNQGVYDISPLAHLTQLESLNLENNNIQHLTPLKELNSLEGLDLVGNKIGSIDYDIFKNLTHLTVYSLYLHNNCITDYSALNKLPHLDGLALLDQEIILPTVTAINGTVEIANPIKPCDGESLEFSLSDGGSYTDGILKWDDIRESKILTVEVWAEHSRYSATIKIPVTYNVLSFPDVEQGKWYTSHIQEFVEFGYLNGYSDGTFKLQNSITRAEFVKIVNKAYGLADKYTRVEELPFTDLDSQWKKDELKVASAAEFRHNDPINRQEAAKIVGYLLGEKLQSGLELEFTDADDIAAWAKDYVAGLVDVGILSKNEIFRPKDSITRAEAVKMLNVARGLVQ